MAPSDSINGKHPVQECRLPLSNRFKVSFVVKTLMETDHDLFLSKMSSSLLILSFSQMLSFFFFHLFGYRAKKVIKETGLTSWLKVSPSKRKATEDDGKTSVESAAKKLND